MLVGARDSRFIDWRAASRAGTAYTLGVFVFARWGFQIKRGGVDDGPMRPSGTNSTEGPINAFDQRNGCSRDTHAATTGRSAPAIRQLDPCYLVD